MPLFEYTCGRCQKTKEVLARSAEDRRDPTCPDCDVPMVKEWSPVAAHTKSSSGCADCPASSGGFT